ncbi:MAG: hypothetical protein J1F22_09375 [Lachnospiraceae bacterium]|nr:hypothetical protein [Lachnospiraceae bacterium]
MIKNLVFRQKLKEAGVTDSMFSLYQQYLDSGNKQGQERLLCQFRRIQSVKLKSDRDKLACLDYMIAKVEKNSNIYENDGFSE